MLIGGLVWCKPLEDVVEIIDIAENGYVKCRRLIRSDMNQMFIMGIDDLEEFADISK